MCTTRTTTPNELPTCSNTRYADSGRGSRQALVRIQNRRASKTQTTVLRNPTSAKHSEDALGATGMTRSEWSRRVHKEMLLVMFDVDEVVEGAGSVQVVTF